MKILLETRDEELVALRKENSELVLQVCVHSLLGLLHRITFDYDGSNNFIVKSSKLIIF